MQFEDDSFYSCIVQLADHWKTQNVVEINGNHEIAKDDESVKGFKAVNQYFVSFPTGLEEKFKNLAVFILENSGISEIGENDLKNLTRLELLNLSKNKIQKIEKNSFKNFNMLRVIDLSGNKLKSIENEIFKDCNRLQMIFIQDNLFDGEINWKAFDKDSTKVLQVTNEPWKCEKTTLKFISKYFDEKMEKIKMKAETTTATTIKVYTTAIIEKESQGFLITFVKDQSLKIIGILILLVLAESIIICCYRCSSKFNSNNNETKSDWKILNEDNQKNNIETVNVQVEKALTEKFELEEVKGDTLK